MGFMQRQSVNRCNQNPRLFPVGPFGTRPCWYPVVCWSRARQFDVTGYLLFLLLPRPDGPSPHVTRHSTTVSESTVHKQTNRDRKRERRSLLSLRSDHISLQTITATHHHYHWKRGRRRQRSSSYERQGPSRHSCFERPSTVVVVIVVVVVVVVAE
jgi:hypothetical protein